MKQRPSARQKTLTPGMTAALKRAARRARTLAALTGTPLVISRNGRIERLRLDDAVGRRKAFEKHMAAAADIPSVKDDPLD